VVGPRGGTRLVAQVRALRWVIDKEVRETVRDPHVLLFLLFPIAVYPLMLWAALQLGAVDSGWQERQAWRVDVQGPDSVVSALLEGNTAADGGLEGLDAGTVDLVATTEAPNEAEWTVTLTHTSRRPRSVAALRHAEARLRQLRGDRLAERAAAAGIPEERLEPLIIEAAVAGGTSSVFQWLIGLILAVLLPTSLMMSGLYPAIDMMVGDRERGTIETTLVTAGPRWILSLGRVAAILLFEAVGVLGNMLGIALTASSLSVTLAADALEIWLPPLSFLFALPALAATALCVTGGLMVALLPARTFKEGEWLGSVVLLLAIGPLVAAIPALVSDDGPGLVLFLPMANTTIALARALEGTMTWAVAVVPVVVNGGIGVALLALATRVVDSEDWLLEAGLPRWLGWVRRWMPG
jgi:sodium transport system permease protein